MDCVCMTAQNPPNDVSPRSIGYLNRMDMEADPIMEIPFVTSKNGKKNLLPGRGNGEEETMDERTENRMM